MSLQRLKLNKYTACVFILMYTVFLLHFSSEYYFFFEKKKGLLPATRCGGPHNKYLWKPCRWYSRLVLRLQV